VRGWNGEKRPTRGRLQEKLREEKAGREGIRLEMAIGGERMERGEETYPGKTAGEVKRGKGRKRGDPLGKMAIGGERMERGEETYPGKTTGGDERKRPEERGSAWRDGYRR